MCSGVGKLVDFGQTTELALSAILKVITDADVPEEIPQVIDSYDEAGASLDATQREEWWTFAMQEVLESATKKIGKRTKIGPTVGKNIVSSAFGAAFTALDQKRKDTAASKKTATEDPNAAAATSSATPAAADSDGGLEKIPPTDPCDPAVAFGTDSMTFAKMATTLRAKYKFQEKIMVHVSTVALFKLKVEAYLEEVCHFGVGVNEKLACDKGFETLVLVNAEQGQKLGSGAGTYCTTPNKNLVLNLIGSVDHVPVVGSLPLCELFGMKWYIQPPLDVSGLTYTSYAPAWSIGLPSSKGPRPDDVQECVLTVEKKTVDYRFAFKALLGEGSSVNVKLTVFQLVMPKGFIKEKPKIIVVRPKIAEALAKETLQAALATDASAKQRADKASDREAKMQFLKEWPCKHLFI